MNDLRLVLRRWFVYFTLDICSMHRPCFPLIIALLFVALTGILHAGDPEAKQMLIGRWRQELVPSGYRIIDRYADGRFAERRLVYTLPKSPSEAGVSWGRWKIHGKHYSEITGGSTLASEHFWIGRWWTRQVVSLSASRFEFLFNDSPFASYEVRECSRAPLLKLKFSHPRAPSALGSNLDRVPTWVNAHP